MFDVQVSPETKDYAAQIVGAGRFGRRGVADGNREEQVTGLTGQIVITDLFEAERPADTGGSDGGTDLEFEGVSIDVKTMGRNCRPRLDYVNNFVALQSHFPTDVLLFCSLNKRSDTLTVCGWIRKEEFLRQASFYPKGSTRTRGDGSTFVTRADLYEIANNALHRPATLNQLKTDLARLS